MSAISIEDQKVTVTLSTLEKLVSLHGNFSVPRSSISQVEVVADGLSGTKGIRAPGLGLPGLRKVGAWRRKGERSFVSVKRGQPAVKVSLSGGGDWTSFLVGADDATALAAQLQSS